MDKSPEAFRTISEVADHLQTPAHVLRFWESRFPQVRPVKRAGGRRYYRPSDVALLGGIRQLLHEEGLTIRGVQKILREQGVRHVAALVAEGAPPPMPEATVPPEPEVAPEAELPPLPQVAPVPRKPPAGPETLPLFDRPEPGAVPAARLRGLPPETILARAEALAPLAARLAALRALMVERGRLARR